MIGRVETRRDEDAVLGLVAGRDRPGRDDARQLDLKLDGAVLVEVPEEAVLIVADSGDRRDDEAARPPHLDLPGAEVRVLPEDAEVLLVNADGVLEDDGLALGVGDDGVEVADLAEAVAAELEAIGEHANAVLALVEGVLPPVGGGGIAVWDDHLGQRGAVEDRPDAAAVLVAHGVQDETLAR